MASSSSQSEKTAEKGDDAVGGANLNSKTDKESKVASGAEGIKENAIKEVASEENGKETSTEKVVSEEGMDVETAPEEDENFEQNAIEDDNEVDASGEDDKEDEVTGGEEEEEEEEDEDEAEEEQEEEENEEEGKEVGTEVHEKETENKVPEQPKGEVVVGEISKGKGKKRIRKKKIALKGSGTVTTEGEDKPESSRKKKATKKVESMGMIFMCSSKTKKDCFRYNVLGLPATKKDLVLKVYKGMRLFLFDFDQRLMYGIYKASAPGGYNIEPQAFNSAFPSQVRFTVLEECTPLGEDKFKAVIKNNYFTKNKFDCKLTAEQVKNLCKLFRASNKGSKSKPVPRPVRAPVRGNSDRDGPRPVKTDRTRPKPRPVERDRNRPRPADQDRRRTGPVDRDRKRARPQSRRERPDGRRGATDLVDRRRPVRRYDRPTMYERETPPPPVVYQLPYPSYERALDGGAYSRDPIVERRDHRPLDLGHRYGDEIGGRDHYFSYRDPPVYRDALYSSGLPVEHRSQSELPPGYRLVAAPPPADYRLSAAAPPPEYDPHRVVYRYY